ncbi:hypothetical protein JYJ95_11660 [Corallococcus exiguus]|nr:hypothetical protein [Corallococcus exiguus]MBN8467176.1 hypothetical protein [Corallococcus exiguus]
MLKPSALVTTTSTEDVVPVRLQTGAVQNTSLVVASLVAGPSEPVLVDQVKVSALFWGSFALTRKTTVPPGAGTVATDWKVSTTSGGKRAVAGLPTQIPRAPVACPPRPSATETVSVHRAHVESEEGCAVGVNRGLAEEPSVQVPWQFDAH